MCPMSNSSLVRGRCTEMKAFSHNLAYDHPGCVARKSGWRAIRAQVSVGFFLEALLQYGTPPHGGIALGLDRIVMILADATSLREVIPSPKTAIAIDLTMDAPTPASNRQLKELGIAVVGKKDLQTTCSEASDKLNGTNLRPPGDGDPPNRPISVGRSCGCLNRVRRAEESVLITNTANAVTTIGASHLATSRALSILLIHQSAIDNCVMC